MSETKSASFFDTISDGVKGLAAGMGKAVATNGTGKPTNQDGGARRKSGMMRLQRSRTRSAARAGGSRKRSSKKRSSKKRKRSSGSKGRSHKRRRGIKGGIGAML